MTQQKPSNSSDSAWLDEDTANFLRLRMKTFYNLDYFEHIVLPLLDIPQGCRVLDVGSGYGGLSLLLARFRPDLHVTGVDVETGMLESAAQTASKMGLINVRYEQGDGHKLKFMDEEFDVVMCQTVLTHVQDAAIVVNEMARVLKRGGVFMAVEYTNSGSSHSYNSVEDSKRDEAWLAKFFRISRLYLQGKKLIGRGDDSLGVRVPLFATAAGLDVFDVRLNDRVLHTIPPYRHLKQLEYLEYLEGYYSPDPHQKGLERLIETLQAVGGTQEEAHWLYQADDDAAIRQAITDRKLAVTSAYMMYITFARKPSISAYPDGGFLSYPKRHKEY